MKYNQGAIWQVVDQMVSDGALGSGERQVALLRYLVQEELEGRGEAMKAYTIGTQVLGRGTGFDPAQDAIVRVEVGRLRKALGLYFATRGQNEAIHIFIDKGTYRPRFVVTQTPGESLSVQPLERTGRPRHARTLVVVFLALLITGLIGGGYFYVTSPTNDPAQINPPLVKVIAPEIAGFGDIGDAMRFGIQSALVQELRTRDWLRVALVAGAPRAAHHQPSFTLRTYVAALGSRMQYSAVLTREPGDDIVWTGRYEDEAEPTGNLGLQRFVAERLVRDLGLLGGPLVESVAQRSEITNEAADNPYRCMINVRRYLRYYGKRQFRDAKICLTRLIDLDPSRTELRAMLSLLLTEEAVLPHLSPPPLVIGGISYETQAARRAALLREAGSVLDALSTSDRPMYSARLFLNACRDDSVQVSETIGTYVGLQTQSGDSYAALGLLSGLFLNNWPMALSAEAKAFSLKSNPAPWYQLPSAARAAMDEDPSQALRLLSRVPMNDYALGLTMIAAFGAEVGANLRVSGARGTLARMGYGDIRALEQLVDQACISRSLKTRIRRGLTTLAANATAD